MNYNIKKLLMIQKKKIILNLWTIWIFPTWGARRRNGGTKRNNVCMNPDYLRPCIRPNKAISLSFLFFFFFLWAVWDCVTLLSSLAACSSLVSADINIFAYVLVSVPVQCFQLLIGEFGLCHDSVFFSLSLLQVLVTIYEHEECPVCLH